RSDEHDGNVDGRSIRPITTWRAERHTDNDPGYDDDCRESADYYGVSVLAEIFCERDDAGRGERVAAASRVQVAANAGFAFSIGRAGLRKQGILLRPRSSIGHNTVCVQMRSHPNG